MRFETPRQPHEKASWGVGTTHRENPIIRPEEVERLRGFLLAEAEALRARNFPVDNECRIDPNEFRGAVYSEAAVVRDQEEVAKRKRGIEKEAGAREASDIGKILEDAVAVAFNKLWFDKRLTKVRTAEYDDYLNGIDELIIDTKTSQIIAAVDTTTNPDLKGPKLRDSVNGSFSVKYGVSLESGIVKMGPLKDIPYAIISISPADLIKLLGELGQEPLPFAEELGQRILGQLEQEMKAFEVLADVQHKNVYRGAQAIFREIRQH